MGKKIGNGVIGIHVLAEKNICALESKAQMEERHCLTASAHILSQAKMTSPPHTADQCCVQTQISSLDTLLQECTRQADHSRF